MSDTTQFAAVATGATVCTTTWTVRTASNAGRGHSLTSNLVVAGITPDEISSRYTAEALFASSC